MDETERNDSPVCHYQYPGGATAFYFEYACLGMDIWYFKDTSQLLPIPWIFGAPIEEFLFWFGATPFCLLGYLYYNRLFRDTRIEEEEIAWPLIALPFAFLTFQLYKMIRYERVVMFKALLAIIVIFEYTVGIVEKISITRGFWAYHTDRILAAVAMNPDGSYEGWLMPWGIPIEEFLVYYWLGAVFVVVVFHFFMLKPQLRLKEAKNPATLQS
jgi:hypothetical protein